VRTGYEFAVAFVHALECSRVPRSRFSASGENTPASALLYQRGKMVSTSMHLLFICYSVVLFECAISRLKTGHLGRGGTGGNRVKSRER